MSGYMDDNDYREPRAPRRNNHHAAPAPYPDYDPVMESDLGPRGSAMPRGADGLPAPPLGEAMKPALKREGSRSRLAPEARLQFEDGVSNLGNGPPDLERKTRTRDKEFRDLRDGYESDEGEAHRSSKYTPAGGRRRRAPPPDEDSRGPRRDRSRSRGPPPPRNYPPPDSMVSTRRGGDPYDDPPPGYSNDGPPPRRRRDRDDDRYEDDYPPRRRRDDPPGVQYGSDPVPARRKSERRPPRRPRDYDEYDEEENYRPRRRRSLEDRRRPSAFDDGPYYSDDPRDRRRDRDDGYGPPRRGDGRRRSYDDDDSRYDDPRPRRDRDKRRSDRPPKEVKIGKYDIGPWIEKGQKHYATLAPIVTPLVLNYARKYLSSKGGGGGGRR